MDKPDLYVRTNYNQRGYTKEVIDELQLYFNWKENNGDTLLDIGSGPGDVLIDFVLPLLPENYGKIVGSDSSVEMVKYGNQTYGSRDQRIQFEILDISDENLKISDRYDHITSFWCLQWVTNLRLGMKNIFNLLTPGRDIILEFGAKCLFTSTLENLSDTRKWYKYLRNVDRFIFCYQRVDNPAKDFAQLLEETGFEDIHCRTKDLTFHFNTFQELIDLFKSINILEQDIPAELRSEFYSDYLEEFKRQNKVAVELENPKNETLQFTATVLIAYAKKPTKVTTQN